MADPILLSLHPSLEPFAREWLSSSSVDPDELDVWPWWSKCSAHGCRPHTGTGCLSCGGCGFVMVAPLDSPAGRALLVAWLRFGSAGCPYCLGDGAVGAGAPMCGPCSACNPDGTGYRRKPHDCAWAADYPEALRECVVRVARGEEPLRGLARFSGAQVVVNGRTIARFDDVFGWDVRTGGGLFFHGDETGDKAISAVRHLLRDLGYYLLEADDG